MSKESKLSVQNNYIPKKPLCPIIYILLGNQIPLLCINNEITNKK